MEEGKESIASAVCRLGRSVADHQPEVARHLAPGEVVPVIAVVAPEAGQQEPNRAAALLAGVPVHPIGPSPLMEFLAGLPLPPIAPVPVRVHGPDWEVP